MKRDRKTAALFSSGGVMLTSCVAARAAATAAAAAFFFFRLRFFTTDIYNKYITRASHWAATLLGGYLIFTTTLLEGHPIEWLTHLYGYFIRPPCLYHKKNDFIHIHYTCILLRVHSHI